jgi:hypothetical protein
VSKKKTWLSIVLGIGLVAASHVVFAETDVDVRMKLGSAAGVDTIEFSDTGTFDASRESSGNFQIEVAFAPQSSSGANFVGTVGVFGRDHEGSDPFSSDEVKYSAAGLSGSAGISVKANQNLHFEGRLELALGSGEPTFTPSLGPTKEGSYVATSLIFGGYFTISKPGLQLGLELGAQSFVGNFQLWDDFVGAWVDGKVKGSGGMANLVIGYRF